MTNRKDNVYYTAVYSIQSRNTLTTEKRAQVQKTEDRSSALQGSKQSASHLLSQNRSPRDLSVSPWTQTTHTVEQYGAAVTVWSDRLSHLAQSLTPFLCASAVTVQHADLRGQVYNMDSTVYSILLHVKRKGLTASLPLFGMPTYHKWLILWGYQTVWVLL